MVSFSQNCLKEPTTIKKIKSIIARGINTA